MSVMEIGRVCVKTMGREKGRRCIIVDVVDKNYVMVTGPDEVTGVRRRRTNMSHLKPLEEKITIKRNASDEEVRKAMERG